jgi:hypothetical protein
MRLSYNAWRRSARPCVDLRFVTKIAVRRDSFLLQLSVIESVSYRVSGISQQSIAAPKQHTE